MRIEYKCSQCGLEGYRLWRQYQTCADAIDLLCADCAERDQEGYELDPLRPDCIGGLVAACPTDDMETFWGYTSVPTERIEWWYSMPLRPSQTIEERMEEFKRLWKKSNRRVASLWDLYEMERAKHVEDRVTIDLDDIPESESVSYRATKKGWEKER